MSKRAMIKTSLAESYRTEVSVFWPCSHAVFIYNAKQRSILGAWASILGESKELAKSLGNHSFVRQRRRIDRWRLVLGRWWRLAHAFRRRAADSAANSGFGRNLHRSGPDVGKHMGLLYAGC